MTTTANEVDEFGPSGSDDFQQQQQEQEPGQQQQQQEQEPSQVMMSKEDIAAFGKELGLSIVQGQQQQTQQQRQMTPEEIDAALQVWKPADDLYDRLGNPETRLAAFVEMRDGLIKQSMTAAQHMIAMELEKVRGEVEPIRSFAQEQRAEKLRNQFTEQYPALKQYEKLMPMVTAALERSGFKPKSVEDGFKTLADEAAKVIKANFDPDFDLSVKPTNQNPNPQGAPTMAKTSSRGGQGGAGSGKTGGSNSPDGGLWD